jgi:hypothetical protein
MIKNKENTDYTNSSILVNNLIVEKYGYTARITRIWELLCDALSIEEFEILDPKDIKPEFESYLVDQYIDWKRGRDVDFSLIKEAILIAGEFTGKEKLLLDQDDVEEKLWGIFLAISDPGRTIKINK